MKVTEETKALAQKVLDYWSLAPRRHRQNVWVGKKSYQLEVEPESFNGIEVNICNTTACAAGTAVMLSRDFESFKDFVRYERGYPLEAKKLLGLEGAEAKKLFYSNNETAKKLMAAIAKGDEEEFSSIDYVGV